MSVTDRIAMLIKERDAARHQRAGIEDERDAALAKLAEVRALAELGGVYNLRARLLAILADFDTAALEHRDKAVAERAWDEYNRRMQADLSIPEWVPRRLANPHRTPPAASTATSETSTRASAREGSD